MSNVFRPVYRELSHEEKVSIEDIKDKAQSLYDIFELANKSNEENSGREIALAKTKLEESVMSAVKGITK